MAIYLFPRHDMDVIQYPHLPSPYTKAFRFTLLSKKSGDLRTQHKCF